MNRLAEIHVTAFGIAACIVSAAASHTGVAGGLLPLLDAVSAPVGCSGGRSVAKPETSLCGPLGGENVLSRQAPRDASPPPPAPAKPLFLQKLVETTSRQGGATAPATDFPFHPIGGQNDQKSAFEGIHYAQFSYIGPTPIAL